MLCPCTAQQSGCARSQHSQFECRASPTSQEGTLEQSLFLHIAQEAPFAVCHVLSKINLCKVYSISAVACQPILVMACRTQQPQEDELRKEDELFRQQPHDEQSHTPSRNGPAKECMQDSTQRRSGAQQKKKKKSSASQAAEFTLSPQEHATKIQAMLEATSQVKCKAGKRQRADSKEQSKQMSEAQDQPSTVKPAEQEGKRLRI